MKIVVREMRGGEIVDARDITDCFEINFGGEVSVRVYDNKVDIRTLDGAMIVEPIASNNIAVYPRRC